MGKIIKVSDDIFDKQLEQLPKEVTFCKKCVISNQRPRIRWGLKEDGGCSACDYGHEKDNEIDWDEKGRAWVIETRDYPNELNRRTGSGQNQNTRRHEWRRQGR